MEQTKNTGVEVAPVSTVLLIVIHTTLAVLFWSQGLKWTSVISFLVIVMAGVRTIARMARAGRVMTIAIALLIAVMYVCAILETVGFLPPFPFP